MCTGDEGLEIVSVHLYLTRKVRIEENELKNQSLVRHVIRLNVQNEQHQRVEKVLANLNKKIYKSTNQFVINAIDYYINSLENKEELIEQSQEKTIKYLTEDDLSDIKRQLKTEMKEEIFRLIGILMLGNRSENISEQALE